MKVKRLISLVTGLSLLSTSVFAAGLSVKNDSGSIQGSTVSYTADYVNCSSDTTSPVTAIAWYENGVLEDFEVASSANDGIAPGEEESIGVSLSGTPDITSRVVGFSLNDTENFMPLAVNNIHNSGSKENNIISLEIDDADGSEAIIDNENKVVSVYIPLYDKNDGSEYSIDNLSTTLTLSENATAKINGTDIEFEGEGNIKTAQVNFADSPMFEIVAENGDVCVYHTKIYRKMELDFEDDLINGAMFNNGAVVYARYDEEKGTVVPEEKTIDKNGVGKYLYFKSGNGSGTYTGVQQYSKAYKKDVVDINGEPSKAMYIAKLNRGTPDSVDTYSLRMSFGNIQSLDKFPDELYLTYDVKYEDVNGDYANDPYTSGLDIYGTKCLYRVSASSITNGFTDSYLLINNKLKAPSNNITEWNKVHIEFETDENSTVNSHLFLNDNLFSSATNTSADLALTTSQKPEFSIGLSARRCCAIYIDNLSLEYLVSTNVGEEEKSSSEDNTEPVKNDLEFVPSLLRSGEITLTGTGNTGYVFASVFKYDETKKVSDMIFDKESVVAIDGVKTNESGDFAFNWKSETDLPSGDYAFVVGNSDASKKMKVMYFASFAEFETAVSEVNEATKANLCTVLEKHSKVLQLESILSSEEYNSYKTMMSEIMMSEKTKAYESDEEIRNAMSVALNACVFITSGKSDVSNNVEAFNEDFGLDAEGYSENAEGVDICFETVSDEYCNDNELDLASTKKILDIAIALAKVNSAPQSSVVDVIEQNEDKLIGLDTSKIPTGSKKRADLAEDIYVFDEPYMTVNELQKAIDKSLSKKPDNNGGGSTGGSNVKKPSSSSGSVAMIVNPTASPEKDEPAISFKDVDESMWAKPYIESLARLGIVSGRGDGMFCPFENVKREEFVKMLLEAMDIPVASNTGSQWYTPYMEAAVENKLIFGYPDGSYGIGENILRQDVAVIIDRVLSVSDNNVDAEKFADDSSISDYAKTAVYNCRKNEIISGNEAGNFMPQSMLTRAEAAKIIYMLISK